MLSDLKREAQMLSDLKREAQRLSDLISKIIGERDRRWADGNKLAEECNVLQGKYEQGLNDIVKECNVLQGKYEQGLNDIVNLQAMNSTLTGENAALKARCLADFNSYAHVRANSYAHVRGLEDNVADLVAKVGELTAKVGELTDENRRLQPTDNVWTEAQRRKASK